MALPQETRNRMAWVLFIVFVSLFVATSVLTVLGLVKASLIREPYFGRLFAASIIEGIATVFSAWKLFSAPEASPRRDVEVGGGDEKPSDRVRDQATLSKAIKTTHPPEGLKKEVVNF